MLCQSVCVVPLGIMATVNVDEDDEASLPALLHAPVVNAAKAAATKSAVAQTRLMRCVRVFIYFFCLVVSAFITARGALRLRALSPMRATARPRRGLAFAFKG